MEIRLVCYRLNEGFASWVEILGLHSASPEFEALNVFVASNYLLPSLRITENLLFT